MPPNEKAPNVAVVGAGISGLMTTHQLVQGGFKVSVYAKGPDPRSATEADHASSTWNGKIGRFISRFEGEPYLGSSPMYPDMQGAFQRHVSDGGWLGKNLNDYSPAERAWLERRAAANGNPSEIERTVAFYVDANRRSMDTWQSFIQSHLELFDGADLHNDNLLRLYDNIPLWHAARDKHEKQNALLRSLSPNEVATEYPAFAEASGNGRIAGGLEVPGFTINVQAFLRNLLDQLEKQGVRFLWNTALLEIQKETADRVTGLVTDSGGVVTADHYSLHQGAYGDSLLNGTPAQERIGGVAGRWLIMQRPKGMHRPVKIHGDVRTETSQQFPVVDINLTPFRGVDGEEYVAVGGGYVFVGQAPFKLDEFQQAFFIIDAENRRTVDLFLRSTVEESITNAKLEKTDATCVRSFTDDDVPLSLSLPAANGGVLTIDGGTNTGTTTIAPHISQSVIARIRQCCNPQLRGQ